MAYMTCAPCWTQTWAWVVLNELEADSTSATATSAAAFIGTGGASGASVEYLIGQGATGPAVTVDIAAGAMSTTWTATVVTAGFHAHRFGPLPEGTKLTLTATDAMARLRWCEPVCC
jgi:hypothetical protein